MWHSRIFQTFFDYESVHRLEQASAHPEILEVNGSRLAMTDHRRLMGVLEVDLFHRIFLITKKMDAVKGSNKAQRET